MSELEKEVLYYINNVMSLPESPENYLAEGISLAFYCVNLRDLSKYHPSFVNRVQELKSTILTYIGQAMIVGLATEEMPQDIHDLCMRFHREDMGGGPVFKTYINND